MQRMSSSLEDAIEAWSADAAWETRLIVRSHTHMLLLFRRRDQAAGWLELGHQRDGAQERAALSRLGLTRKRWAEGAKAWGRSIDVPPASTRELADTLRSLWQAACGDEPLSRDVDVEVLSQREQPPTNERLVDAMRAAARARDTTSRQRLYAALANATLLVPIDPRSAQQAPAEQHPLALSTDEQGLVTWAAFSDWNALRQWRPQAHPFGLVHGTDFFRHVHDLGRCTVRVNPDGVVGGELYPQEIKMMADALRRFYGQST